MFGARLRELRKKKKMTMKELGAKFSLAESTISGYENGNRKPDLELINAFADFFEVSVDYLLGRTDNPETKSTITVAGQSVSLSPDELRVFKELIKHQAMFHDLATDPEKKVKQLIKLYKMKKILFEEDDDDEEYGDGFGEFED
ncbi:helix-turn-helix domain-containing protein [Bacillus badius]|uniref:Transcriptional regulator n=1 Tax=Bacillus badius TaxID=1455 RepID=A0ABR5APC3_BACBA|nr:helix-turn-helix domain-containing protein [Bacillus badius]KIL74180.1 transcriptional regulator [Bacillus badius]MED4718173.1 helix-turn-helix domain-containing protein [Bacillus badius]